MIPRNSALAERSENLADFGGRVTLGLDSRVRAFSNLSYASPAIIG